MYRINQVCELLGVCRNTLAKYTKMGLKCVIKRRRGKRGVKFYKGKDILFFMGYDAHKEFIN